MWVRNSDRHKERKCMRERISEDKIKTFTFLIFNLSNRQQIFQCNNQQCILLYICTYACIQVKWITTMIKRMGKGGISNFVIIRNLNYPWSGVEIFESGFGLVVNVFYNLYRNHLQKVKKKYNWYLRMEGKWNHKMLNSNHKRQKEMENKIRANNKRNR